MTGIIPATEFESHLYNRGDTQGKMAGFEGSLDQSNVETLVRGRKNERIWPADSKWKDEGVKIYELELDFLPQEFSSDFPRAREKILYELFATENPDKYQGLHFNIIKKEVQFGRPMRRRMPEGYEFTGKPALESQVGTPFKPLNKVYTNICTTGSMWVPGAKIIDGIEPEAYAKMLQEKRWAYQQAFSESGNEFQKYVALALAGAEKGFSTYLF